MRGFLELRRQVPNLKNMLLQSPTTLRDFIVEVCNRL